MLESAFFTHGLPENLLEGGPILAMDPLYPRRVGWLRCCIEAKYAPELHGRRDFIRTDPPAPAAGVADPLRFAERRFAPPQLLLRPPPIAVLVDQIGIEAGIL